MLECLHQFLYGFNKPSDIDKNKDVKWVPAVKYLYNQLSPNEKEKFNLFERMANREISEAEYQRELQKFEPPKKR